MPNLVGRLALEELKDDIDQMGSCVLVGFDKMTVSMASELRNRLRSEGTRLKVVRNRWAVRALEEAGFELPRITGKCGLVLAPEEKAITAAKIVREYRRSNREVSLSVVAGIIEGKFIGGEEAKTIADMPDKQTVRTMLVTALSGPARGLATAMRAVPSGLARCLEQRSEGQEDTSVESRES